MATMPLFVERKIVPNTPANKPYAHNMSITFTITLTLEACLVTVAIEVPEAVTVHDFCTQYAAWLGVG